MPTDLPLLDLLGLAYHLARLANDPDLIAVLDAITDPPHLIRMEE